MTPVRSSPSEARRNARTEVGNLVCTTDCSAANGKATTAALTPPIGLAASTVIDVTAVPSPSPRTASITSSTSVVVPEREIATIRS